MPYNLHLPIQAPLGVRVAQVLEGGKMGGGHGALGMGDGAGPAAPGLGRVLLSNSLGLDPLLRAGGQARAGRSHHRPGQPGAAGGQAEPSHKWTYVKRVSIDGVPALIGAGFYE